MDSIERDSLILSLRFEEIRKMKELCQIRSDLEKLREQIKKNLEEKKTISTKTK